MGESITLIGQEPYNLPAQFTLRYTCKSIVSDYDTVYLFMLLGRKELYG
jgi:hypothetical protein